METIGINQGAGGSENYPLIAPSNDIKGLIADLNLSLKRVNSVEVSIYCLQNFQNVISNDERADVILNDEDGNELWNSSVASEYSHHLWGNAYHIFHWGNQDVQLTIIVRDRQLQNLKTDLYPQSAKIDYRAVSCLAPHIYSIKVTDRYGQTHLIKNKKVIIEAGYNIELTNSKATGIREAATVTVEAKAGAGKGRAPLDFVGVVPGYDGLFLKYLNGISPDEKGRINLVGEDGYGLEIPEDDFHKVYIRNTDVPCCDCKLLDALDIYINEVASQYNEIGKTAENLRSELAAIIKKWNKIKAKYPGLTMASATVQGVSAACHRFTIRADITNKMPFPASISLSLSFTPMAIRTATYSSSYGVSETVVYQECDNYVTTTARGTVPVPQSSSPNSIGAGTGSYSKSWSNVPPGASVSVQLAGTKKSRGNATVTATGSISGKGGGAALVFYPSSTISITSPCTGSPNELFDMTHPEYDNSLLKDYYDYIWDLRDTPPFKTNRKPKVDEVECEDEGSL